MAATEGDIIRDEQERSNLLRAIADVETAIAGSSPSTRRILENTLENARKRVVVLDKKIEEAKVEHAAEVQAQATAAAALAAKETKLSAEERKTYRGFLEESYFTKKDIGRLDEFYTHSYDRLSEGGKEEMSERLHEGIRRGELKSTDLPDSVLKRDAELCRKHTAIGTTEPTGHTTRADKQTHTQDGANSATASDGVAAKPSDSFPNAEIDLSSVDLSGVKLVAATSKPAAASIPDASGQGAKGRA